MNPADLIIGGVIAALFILCIIYMIRRRKKKGACSCGCCDGCGGQCPGCNDQNNKKKNLT